MNSRTLVLLAAAAALILRLAFGLGYWVGKPMTHDEHEYLSLARNLNAGRGFTYEPPAGGEPEREHFGRAPVYPLFLAGALRIAGDDRRHDDAPRSVKIAQAFIGVGTVLLVAAITRRAAGDRAAVIAAWIAAVYPPLVFIGAYVLSESLFAALALASVWVLENARLEAGSRSLLAAGALTGLAALTRPVMLVFMALATLNLARRRLVAAVAFGIAALIVIAPWTLHNVRTHGRFILIASEGGITFWTGNHPLARGEGDLAANPRLKLANRDLRARHAGLTPEQLEPVYYREAFAAIAQQPVRWIGLLARKAFYFWVPIGPSYTLHSARYRLATTVPYLVLLPVAALGAFTLRRRPTTPRALFLLALSSFIAAIVFFPQERFRIPILDPTLIVCAAAWLAGRKHHDAPAA